MSAAAKRCACGRRAVKDKEECAECRDPNYDKLHTLERQFRKQKRKEKGKP